MLLWKTCFKLGQKSRLNTGVFYPMMYTNMKFSSISTKKENFSADIFKHRSLEDLKNFYRENIGTIRTIEAIQFLDHANTLGLISSQENHQANLKYKEYISSYAIKNIVFSLSSCNPFDIMVFLETIVLCKDDIYKKDLFNILRTHKLRNIQNLVYEHLIYAEQEKLQKSINQLDKDQTINILFFLARYAIIDSELYLHGLLLSHLHSKVDILGTMDLMKVFNIFKSLKMIYSQVLNSEKRKDGIPAKEISLLKFEKKIRDLVFYYFTVKNPELDKESAIYFLNSGYLGVSGSLIPKNIRSKILKSLDFDEISVKDLIQYRVILSDDMEMEEYTKKLMDRILTKDKRAIIELDFKQLATLIRMVCKYYPERVQILYNYCSNVMDRKVYDLTLNLDSLCDIIHSFTLAKQIKTFSDPILTSAIPIINIVGLESLSSGKRLEILWALVRIAQENINDQKSLSSIRSILPHLEKILEMSFKERLKIYHFSYIVDINKFYKTVHGKDLFDKYVLARCKKVQNTLFRKSQKI
ncbi:unnamed protein product [Moneuplotes crassus]|uniref:Uncharacterized protein n=1 Tax=Euplotes crassus TaxID=5936 RepID=A0AAD1UBR7_EUPCR|nr:unnamed protein product [Moneuplotes crassus]